MTASEFTPTIEVTSSPRRWHNIWMIKDTDSKKLRIIKETVNVMLVGGMLKGLENGLEFLANNVLPADIAPIIINLIDVSLDLGG